MRVIPRNTAADESDACIALTRSFIVGACVMRRTDVVSAARLIGACIKRANSIPIAPKTGAIRVKVFMGIIKKVREKCAEFHPQR